ncbi:MAG: glycine cleavage T C-terminal barrel domain-containing protein, partial [Alphaproteobacteria bacterium]
TPMHPWHLQSGAPFEDVGQWKRPWYFPKAGEDMHAAVQRECKAVRDSLGIMDASTLGKIDVKGPDAAEFLNRVYSNAFMKLAPGKCRYGLMLGEDGMIMDDGVTSRIADDHFVMTTTTGGAANVLAHLEDYLQTEWQDLQVYLTSVTEQWATATIAGPNARRLMQDVCKDIDLSNEAFPFMSWREGEVLDLPARVFRISFSGELAFEINVPADYGLALWQGLIDEGRKYNITPYGTESMHVLRAEKGFIIVGQDTDGSMTPFDMGLGGMVSKVKPDFVGKRSLSRIDIVAEGRKQLVGLLTTDPNEVIPEGSHLLNEPTKEYPAPMLGFASSSYFSPNTNTSIAMALVKGGLDRMGDTIYAARSDGSFIECKITSPVFFDKEGARQHA